ncbi:MAG: leucine-rich repeat protein [Treponema sp.]|jgi:tetratricopeptide (TPR) repeat protein|nr:leucine-rich repeat protein [Treponema sp.]
MWKCRKCGQERARRQSTDCEAGGEHDWADRDEVNAELEHNAEIRRQEAEKRRQEAERAYRAFLDSAEGQAELVKIANGHLARRKRASLGLVISGVITLITALIFCGLLYKYLVIDEAEASYFEILKALLPAVIPGSISITFFQKFWKTFSDLQSELRRVHNAKTGRALPLIDAARFLASRDIARRFAYKDEYGASCVPDTLTPAPIDTTKVWKRKMEHAAALFRDKNYAEAAEEYKQIGNNCGVLDSSAPAWLNAAICYDKLHDERTPAYYKKAIRNYKKLVKQRHDGAQERLDQAIRNLEKFHILDINEEHTLTRCKGKCKTLTIPDDVTSIGKFAFSDCKRLESVTISGSVTSIGDGAFSGCKKLANIIIPAGVTSIGKWAFLGDALTSVTFAEGSDIAIEDFGSDAFKSTPFMPGNALREAYFAAMPRAGTYTREPDGKIWTKEETA